jgi:hypothetical protein
VRGCCIDRLRLLPVDLRDISDGVIDVEGDRTNGAPFVQRGRRRPYDNYDDHRQLSELSQRHRKRRRAGPDSNNGGRHGSEG